MNDSIKAVVLKNIPNKPDIIRKVGMGYYADVYRFGYENKDPVIVKVYKNKGMLDNEVSQLGILGEYSRCPVPRVLWTHKADESCDYDILAMTYIHGTVGGLVRYLNPAKKALLAGDIVDCLLSCHNVHNANGFGEIGSDKRYETFNECYRHRAEKIIPMAEELHKKGELTDYVFSVIQKGMCQFDRIFYLPITEASLIHGDYNTWNIMVDKKNCRVSGVIDPCGCMWADSEFDLYQLLNYNGKDLRLLETYAEKRELSENYRQKTAFYRLFTSVEHYYISKHRVKRRKIKRSADALNEFLD